MRSLTLCLALVLVAALAVTAPVPWPINRFVAPTTVSAQGVNAIAFCTFSTIPLLGPVQPNQTNGWDWQLFCALNSAAGANHVIIVNASTLSGDTLAQVGVKLANAAKAEAVSQNMNVTAVLLPAMSIVQPTN